MFGFKSPLLLLLRSVQQIFSSGCTRAGACVQHSHRVGYATLAGSILIFCLVWANGNTPKMDPEKNFYSISIVDAYGNNKNFTDFKGKVLVIVNTASDCGFAKNAYPELAQLLEKFGDKDLKVLLFPCNQFKTQEPNDIDVIKEKVAKYSKNFILFNKVDVKGDNQHPVYKYLTKSRSGWFGETIEWNFTKFLVDKRGKVIERYTPLKSISLSLVEKLCSE